MSGHSGLKNNVPPLTTPSGPPGDLSEELKSSLSGAEIWDMQANVAIDYSDEYNSREIVPLGDHLSTYKDVNFAFAYASENLNIVLD